MEVGYAEEYDNAVQEKIFLFAMFVSLARQVIDC